MNMKIVNLIAKYDLKVIYVDKDDKFYEMNFLTYFIYNNKSYLDKNKEYG